MQPIDKAMFGIGTSLMPDDRPPSAVGGTTIMGKYIPGYADEVAYEGNDPVKRYKDTVSRQGKIAARRK